MQFRLHQLCAVLSIVTAASASPAASPDFSLNERTYFPGCLSAPFTDGDCSCKCVDGYKIEPPSTPYTEGAQLICQAPNSNIYGPVGAFS